ncbi:PadR family transcriptional regulator [Bradyrhizobium manausense]|uniref:PadR family transcriptional regulator n=1 Tax=Bradyrhizobium manausense TaxID=989370 RepID=UPI001BAB9293|nr:PadR family transcriptional regulator [Bradyrhizobium manausense]MBR0686938.1 PadR family transcriptional regulator [Bradyrhizobium manausense]MBR0726162.1 PadR family transcriptional regulator [Bradyrhizobium manausense]
MFSKHREHRDFHFGHFAHFGMGRHGGRHRFGRGGHGFFGRGGDDFPGARRLASQDLQLVILALLAEKPAHGYELIKIIEERSEGFYTPSPGVIYPALTYLEEVGHTSVAQDGGRKLYSITPQGEAHLAEQRGTADAILQALSRIGRRMDEVREAFAGVSDLDADASDELHRARHNLKRALRSKHGSDSAEARRIAGILERAAAEILGK